MKPDCQTADTSASSWLRSLLAGLSAAWPFSARQCFSHLWTFSTLMTKNPFALQNPTAIIGKHQQEQPKDGCVQDAPWRPDDKWSFLVFASCYAGMAARGGILRVAWSRVRNHARLGPNSRACTLQSKSCRQTPWLLPPNQRCLSITGFQIEIWIKTTSIS